MNVKELIKALFELSDYAIKKFDEYVSSGRINIIKEPYAKYIIEDFNYSKSGIGFRGTTKYIIKEVLDPLALHEFIKDLSKEDIFKHTMKIMARLYDVPEARINHWLEIFINKLIHKQHYDRNLDCKELAYMINTFINEIEGNPIDWRIEVWLNGVFLEIPTIELEKGVVLRAPRKEDLEHDSSSHIPPPPSSIFLGFPSVPDAIIEINKRIKAQSTIIPYKEKLIILLQLYKLCSVHEIGTRWVPQGILSIAFTSHARKTRLQIIHKCTLNENDSKRLPSFIRDMMPHIPLDERTGRILVDNHIGVALSRYRDVLLKPEPIPNKIAYATFGLEALYLKSDEMGELKHKLALRVAKILGKLNIDNSKNILSNVKKAYNIRSVFVHGGSLKGNKYQDRSLLDKIAEYLRVSLLLFMQVPMNKDKLINLIDDALIDESSDRELKQIIETIRYL